MAGKTVKIILVFLLFTSSLVAQNSDKVKTAQSLFQMLETYHYNPPKRNSVLSNHIFESLVKTLDPYGLFFTGETISSFKPYRDSLCSHNSVLISEFMVIVTDKYRNQLSLADSIVDRCFGSPINLTENDSLILEPEDASKRPKNNSELEVRWKKWIKQGMLRSLMYSGNDSALINSPIIPDSLYARGSLLVKKSRIREKRWINQLLNYSGGIENFVINSYFNSITSCYDPHSNYFSDNDKEKFESSLSKENYAFGFELGSNLNEEVIISRVLPGSPLWYSKKLDKGDVILKIKIPEQEAIDLTFASIEEIDNIFRTLNGDGVEMTIRKLNGSISKVELTKGKFDTKENQTLGFILKGEKPVGYIWFSAFYTEFGRYGNVGCSIDFLKEMVKLKESGVNGLIIDLRNNPGGSEGEAMEIAAYFAGNGPFAIRKNKEGGQNILEKTNAIKWYDEPVVVLVNGSSASASELLAAILQDYGRAVIIGTNTFGKASEQLVFPVGQKMRTAGHFTANPPPEITDFAKVTTGRLYRVTGKSYQKVGVMPDVVLPDVWDNFISRESAMPFALKNDSVGSSVKFSPSTKLPLDTLASLSKSRITKNEKFRQVTNLNNSMKTLMRNKNKATLQLGQYKNDADKRKQLSTEFENINSSENKLFKVENTSFKMREMQADSLSMEINDKFKDSVQKDIYVGEAFSVVIDLLGAKSTGSPNK
jgi:carboxyl-terminal processing protease